MTPFGIDAKGREVHAVTLTAGDLTVRLLTLGATLQEVRLAGVDRSLTLSSDNPADFAGPLLYFGALVGPLVNRLDGAKATIGGTDYQFDANQNGQHMLHSGASGTWGYLWQVVEETPNSVTFALDLSAGEGGFPGNRHVTARFSVTAPATLRMEVTGTTDSATLMNFANHSYWNLDGSPTWEGHTLRVAAGTYLPVGDGLIPSGEVCDVTGSGFDLREGPQPVPGNPGFDHNFCLSHVPVELRDVLWLTGQSGVTMTYATTEPGVQIYDGGHTARPGHGTYEGFAIEAQRWPDGPHHAHFPSVALNPGEVYSQVTEWRFSLG